MVESPNPAQSRLESSDMSIDVTLQSKNTDTKSKHASVTYCTITFEEAKISKSSLHHSNN